MPIVELTTFNVENLFARYQFRRNEDPEQATAEGWRADQTRFDLYDDASKRITGEATDATKSDVLCLQEVEGGDTLKRFRNNYLDGGSRRYPYYALIDGNDPRYIDVAVLSRRPIISVTSWQHERTSGKTVFSRDCLEVDLEAPDGSVLTVYVNHYKSMLGGRPATRARRLSQARRTLKLIKERFGDNAGDHEFAVLGDFNDYMEAGNGIAPLVEWDQVENVVDRLPQADRWTHYWAGGNDYRQLDYILLSNALTQRLVGLPKIERRGMPHRATRYTGERFAGVGQNVPKASDHCPVTVRLRY